MAPCSSPRRSPTSPSPTRSPCRRIGHCTSPARRLVAAEARVTRSVRRVRPGRHLPLARRCRQRSLDDRHPQPPLGQDAQRHLARPRREKAAHRSRCAAGRRRDARGASERRHSLTARLVELIHDIENGVREQSLGTLNALAAVLPTRPAHERGFQRKDGHRHRRGARVRPGHQLAFAAQRERLACDVLTTAARTQRLCFAAGGMCTTRVVDVRDKPAARGRRRCVGHCVHILVTTPAASGGRWGVRSEVTPGEWQGIFEVNVTGAFYLSQAVAPGMKAARFGRTSTSGRRRAGDQPRHSGVRVGQGGADRTHPAAGATSWDRGASR